MADANTATPLPTLLTSPDSLAAASWLGLIVTLAGFAVALYQISKIKTASDASATATKTVLNLIKERINLTELVYGTNMINNIRDAIVTGRYDGATILIRQLRSTLIHIQELLEEQATRADISGFLVDLDLISRDLERPKLESADINILLSSLVPMGDMLERHIARLRFPSEELPD